jgi:hypothetical protein
MIMRMPCTHIFSLSRLNPMQRLTPTQCGCSALCIVKILHPTARRKIYQRARALKIRRQSLHGALHSYIFSQQAKPHAAIDALFSALLPFGKSFVVRYLSVQQLTGRKPIARSSLDHCGKLRRYRTQATQDNENALHSYIFSQQAKPHAAIDALFSALLPFGKSFVVQSGEEFSLYTEQSSRIEGVNRCMGFSLLRENI